MRASECPRFEPSFVVVSLAWRFNFDHLAVGSQLLKNMWSNVFDPFVGGRLIGFAAKSIGCQITSAILVLGPILKPQIELT